MSKDFHFNAFDDATKLKLEIYRSYIEEWLPVFIKLKADSSWNGTINIFDFLCGPGKDKDGNLGSPLIAIEQCKKYVSLLKNNRKKVSLVFNDSRKNKMKELRQLLEESTIPNAIKIATSIEKFKVSFQKNMKEISKSANLIFIDQCGIKEVNQNVFRSLIGLKRTDFLFFFASSHFKRFREEPYFKKHLDSKNFIDENTNHDDIHRVVATMYREMIPTNSSYYLAPFSLKKGSNIYGLIFGSSNLLGILKFIEICWKIDPERGEANYDIDSDKLTTSGYTRDMFDDNTKAKKIVDFQYKLKVRLLNGCFNNDKEILVYSLENGFVPTKHAKEVVLKLIKEEILICPMNPRFSKICIKEPRTLRLR